MASLGMSADDKTAIEAFKQDVIEPSMTNLVILDFWAEWCGPCKQLTPVLEAVAARYADKGVLLAKINVDENKMVAAQFQVRSIPTVYAVFKGKLVADLTQYRSETQLAQALDQILRQLPVQGEAQALEAEIEPLLAMGEDVLGEGDAARAASVFAQIVEMAPNNPEAQSGLIRALAASGDMAAAEDALAAVPEDQLSHAAIQRAASAIALTKDVKPLDDMSGLIAKVEVNPKDYAARFELANGLMANGDHDGAANHLLEIIAANRDWDDGAARTRLLKIFEVIGLEDEWVATTRRRLSAILFG